MKVLEHIEQAIKHKKKMFAVLLDPDKLSKASFLEIIHTAEACEVDYFFVGGSLLTEELNDLVVLIKKHSRIPVILFPGNGMHIAKEADGLLFLSLISGRNADFLIGQQVVAAPLVKKANLEVLSTGYMLVDCGTATSVSYMSNTMPIPYDKSSIAACTAMAGELLGLKLFFLDGGSGAQKPISRKMIAAVRKAVQGPIIVGGGIQTPGQAVDAWTAGADIVVIGNAIENDLQIVIEVAEKAKELNEQV
jgi:phosphoglycerol geranylgeranyltransferase